MNITCEDVVKLHGIVDIDFNLSFDHHIGNICNKSVHQLNAMRRIGHNLSLLNRLTIFFHTFVLVLPVLSNLLQKCGNVYNFRYSNILQIPTVVTGTFGKTTSRYAAPVLWNSLPEDFRNCTNFNQFRQELERM